MLSESRHQGLATESSINSNGLTLYFFIWVQEGKSWHFGQNWAFWWFAKFNLNYTIQNLFQVWKVLLFLWAKQDAKKQ